MSQDQELAARELLARLETALARLRKQGFAGEFRDARLALQDLICEQSPGLGASASEARDEDADTATR